MDEELKVITQEFYDEILKRDKNPPSTERWEKATEFALQKMMVDNLDEIRQEIREVKDQIIKLRQATGIN